MHCDRQMMAKQRRGRPRTFAYESRRKLAELIRLYGVRPTSELSEEPVSVGTLLKIAREFGIELRKGRRPREAA